MNPKTSYVRTIISLYQFLMRFFELKMAVGLNLNLGHSKLTQPHFLDDAVDHSRKIMMHN
jgi:hypothetical protein